MASTPQQGGEARQGNGIIGWKLDRQQRRELLERFPPRYGNVVADHVTLKTRAATDAPLPGATAGTLVGRADDGQGVECMVVAIGGSTDRPGPEGGQGGTYHITWSLGPGRQARESNDVLAAGPWADLDEPVAIRLMPARLR